MKGIKYCCPINDVSGYGNSSREYVLSLHKKGVPIRVTPHCFETNPPPVGTEREGFIFRELVGSDIDYDVVISQLTPDMAVQHYEEGKYNIAYFAWETSFVHPHWVKCLNRMQEVWTPSAWNVEAIRSSGVTVPVHKIPHGISPDRFDGVEKSALEIAGLDKNSYKFYNIFQWSARKNPESLIRAYFNAFNGDDNVVLLLKTYIGKGGPVEQKLIIEYIQSIKKDMGFSKYPRIVLLTDLLNDLQMKALHLNMDCFVSLHTAEGFGLTPFEAGLAGNPVIATGMGGNMEFMNAENSFPVNFQWTYVKNMSSFNQWYLGNGQWASPEEPHAAHLMRYAYNNREAAKVKGSLLSKYIKDNFSWDKVSDMMLARLKQVV